MQRYLPTLEGLGILLATLPLGLWQPGFWLLVPFVLITATKRSFDEYGLRWEFGSLRFHALVCALVLGGYAAGHYLWGTFIQGAKFDPRLPQNLGRLIFHQFVDVALPEEFFFRAYLQSQLNRTFGRPYRFLQVRWGLGLPLAAALFALCHLIYGNIWQLKVFFFGVFAGWLRERNQSIAAPIVYHAAGNILLEFMTISFR
jgi:membrane protease YdiL (CAAX protease family)